MVQSPITDSPARAGCFSLVFHYLVGFYSHIDDIFIGVVWAII